MKRRVKETRKLTDRKYYEKSRKSVENQKTEEDASVKQWKCTLLSRNNGLTPRPQTMTTDDYLLVHEKAQQLIESMGYDDGAKK